jgi:DnaJ-class molecular chaperone
VRPTACRRDSTPRRSRAPFGGARAPRGGVEFSGDFDVGDIFSSLFGGGGGGPAAQWGDASRPRQSAAPT